MHHRTTDITASKHYIEHFSVTLAGKNKEGATKKPLGRFHHLCFEMKLRKISQWPRIYIWLDDARIHRILRLDFSFTRHMSWLIFKSITRNTM